VQAQDVAQHSRRRSWQWRHPQDRFIGTLEGRLADLSGSALTRVKKVIKTAQAR
jgi:hypothetical protein